MMRRSTGSKNRRRIPGAKGVRRHPSQGGFAFQNESELSPAENAKW
jgi:hypothetical protein